MRAQVQAWWTGTLIIGDTKCKEEWELYFTGNCKAFHVNDESLYILCKNDNSEKTKKTLICKNYCTFMKGWS